MKTAVEVERRTLEVSAKENSYWREYFQALTNSRLAPVVDGDLDAIFELSERTREELLDGITPAIVREHLRECLKVQDRVVVVLRAAAGAVAEGVDAGPDHRGGARRHELRRDRPLGGVMRCF